MNLTISGHHLEVTPALHNYVTQKLERVITTLPLPSGNALHNTLLNQHIEYSHHSIQLRLQHKPIQAHAQLSNVGSSVTYAPTK